MGHSMVVTILRCVAVLVVSQAVRGAAANPGDLTRIGDTLRGTLAVGDRVVDATILDKNKNGAFTDKVDRLHLDLDGNGEIHPLRERFPASGTLRLRNFGSADRFEITLRQKPWRVRLIPIEGQGTIRPTLLLGDESTEVTRFEATLVSRAGLHRQVTEIGTKLKIPAGKYRLEKVTLDARKDRRWTWTFENLHRNRAFSIDVRPDQEVEVELLGSLRLRCSQVGGGVSGALTLHPSVESKTGLILTKSCSGEQAATSENRLTAALKDRDQARTIDLQDSGFACGQLCPVNFKSSAPIRPGMWIVLRLENGPIGGSLQRTFPVKHFSDEDPR